MSQWQEIVENILKENNVVLNEAKQVGNLYHATTIAALEDILKSDKLISTPYNTGTSDGISTTRDKTFFYQGPLSIILDGNKLSENYKVIPFSALDDLDGYEHRAEHETVIIPNNLPKDYDIWDTEFIIPNIHKYITGILVKPNLFASKGQTKDLYNILKNYNYPIYTIRGQKLNINEFNKYHNQISKLSNKECDKDEELHNRFSKVRDNSIDKEEDHYSTKDKLIKKSQNEKIQKELNNLLLQRYGKTYDEIWKQNIGLDSTNPNYISLLDLEQEVKNKLYNNSDGNRWYKFESIVKNILQENHIYLDEAKQVGLLYHTTNKDGILGILKSNSLISNRYNGISFSRDKNNQYGNGAFTLVFDGNKLSENNKLYPYSWHNVYPEDCIGVKDRNSEESLIPRGYKKQEFDSETFNLFGDIDYTLKDINKYLLGLIINIDNENLSLNEIQNIIYLFKVKYPNKYIQIK